MEFPQYCCLPKLKFNPHSSRSALAAAGGKLLVAQIVVRNRLKHKNEEKRVVIKVEEVGSENPMLTMVDRRYDGADDGNKCGRVLAGVHQMRDRGFNSQIAVSSKALKKTPPRWKRLQNRLKTPHHAITKTRLWHYTEEESAVTRSINLPVLAFIMSPHKCNLVNTLSVFSVHHKY